MPSTITLAEAAASPRPAGRFAVIALLAFLTVVDLFATQAILPTLTQAYATTPTTMSLAVNASTLGMAAAGLVLSLLGRRIPRRIGVVSALLALTLPTLLLAGMPPLPWFALLRIVQGLCMATAFTLTLAHLGERPDSGASAFAAYIAGNVASNLFGRLLSAAAADHFGLAGNFLVFAVLNAAGAMLAAVVISPTDRHAPPVGRTALAAWMQTVRSPAARSAFALGFCILFAFIGTFTYVNFVLARPPFGLDMMAIGLAYIVFLPSVITTPAAGRLVSRWGERAAGQAALALAIAGLPLLLLPRLAAVLLGLVLVSVGTFLAQAVATGFVARHAPADRATASGLYLCCYFLGGLAGSFGLGLAFDHAGWMACVVGTGIALVAGVALARGLTPAPG